MGEIKKSSNRIAKLRKEKGLTLQQVADAIGVGNNTISRYENGKREPNLATWLKLATFFNVSIEYLMGISNQSEIEGENELSDIFNSFDKVIEITQKIKKTTEKKLDEENLEVEPKVFDITIDTLKVIRSAIDSTLLKKLYSYKD